VINPLENQHQRNDHAKIIVHSLPISLYWTFGVNHKHYNRKRLGVWFNYRAAVATVDWVLALQPGEVAASVDVQWVERQGFTNVHPNKEVAAEVQKKRVKNVLRKPQVW
jgi:hypothetical protein